MDHSRMTPLLVGAAAMLAVFAVLGVPVLAAVPYLFLLACPLMMIFMMRGMHGGHGSSRDHDNDEHHHPAP